MFACGHTAADGPESSAGFESQALFAHCSLTGRV